MCRYSDNANFCFHPGNLFGTVCIADDCPFKGEDDEDDDEDDCHLKEEEEDDEDEIQESCVS